MQIAYLPLSISLIGTSISHYVLQLSIGSKQKQLGVHAQCVVHLMFSSFVGTVMCEPKTIRGKILMENCHLY